MKTYIFQVTLEQDAEGWRAFFPPFEDKGASTWGKTQEEALKNIQEVMSMIVEELSEEGSPIPADLFMTEGPAVAVHVRVPLIMEGFNLSLAVNWFAPLQRTGFAYFVREGAITDMAILMAEEYQSHSLVLVTPSPPAHYAALLKHKPNGLKLICIGSACFNTIAAIP